MTVGAGAAPAGGADVWLARYIPRTVEVAIPRGENAGHTLPYKDVVREMVLLGHWRGEAATFPLPGGARAGPRRGGDRAGRGLRADSGGRQALNARANGRISRYPVNWRETLRPGFQAISRRNAAAMR